MPMPEPCNITYDEWNN